MRAKCIQQSLSATMRAVLLLGFVLVASAAAFVEVQKGYHDEIGIPRAAEIKAFEDGQLGPNRVVGGALAPAGAQPFFGGLLISLMNVAGQSVCGSSLLSATRSITAAHCWFDGVRQATQFTVIFDSTNLFSGGVRVLTNHVVMHPQWTPRNLNNDVAIIYLPFSVLSARIQPISIPTATETWDTFAGQWATATGFGRTNDAQAGASTVLSRVNLQIISFEQCRWVFQPGVVVESTLCTNGAGAVGICGGDSGGPLALQYNGRLTLVGVSSFVAASGCQLGFPSAFARVTSFRNFIVQHL